MMITLKEAIKKEGQLIRNLGDLSTFKEEEGINDIKIELKSGSWITTIVKGSISATGTDSDILRSVSLAIAAYYSNIRERE